MTPNTGGSIARVEFHAPYHPNVLVRVLDKYYSIDGACSNRSDKYVHWITHFHFDHIRSSVAGGADFLLKQDEKITIYAPDDETPVEEGLSVFDIHQHLYHTHSKGKRQLVPVSDYENLHINGTTIESVPLKHSVPNNAIFLKNKEADFTVFVTGDWLGSDEENREAIVSREPSILVTECRYIQPDTYDMTSSRMHTHLNDLIALKELLPNTVIIPYHLSRTFSDISYLNYVFHKHGFVFGKKILFYNDTDSYKITEEY
jgi:ribonuclease BN (tRNA processing enzyme)